MYAPVSMQYMQWRRGTKGGAHKGGHIRVGHVLSLQYLPLRGREGGVLVEEEALRVREDLDEEGLHKKRFHFNCGCNTIGMGPGKTG